VWSNVLDIVHLWCNFFNKRKYFHIFKILFRISVQNQSLHIKKDIIVNFILFCPIFNISNKVQYKIVCLVQWSSNRVQYKKLSCNSVTCPVLFCPVTIFLQIKRTLSVLFYVTIIGSNGYNPKTLRNIKWISIRD
jgi:hypothetical protein